MKKLIIIFLSAFGIYGVTGHIIGQFNFGIDLQKTETVINSSNQRVGLYPEKPDLNETIAYLKPGMSLPFAYLGKTGGWKYVWLNGQVVSIRSDQAELGYQVFRRWEVPQQWVKTIYSYSLIGTTVSFGLIIFTAMFTIRTRKKTINIEEVNYYRRQSALKDIQNTQLREMLETQRRVYKENENHQYEKAKQAEARLRRELEKTARIESEVRYQTSINEMQTSYDRLFEKYLRVKNEAGEFGIDFDHPKYEELLKGRRYELCVATSLVNGGKFNILEWTPDKGFESNIKVNSNTNPDLVVEDMAGNINAIECKYRSTYYYKRKNNIKEISWSKLKQVERYQAFAERRGIPVWVALGFDEESQSPDPRSPKRHYLIPLTRICNNSRQDNPDGKGIQLIIPQSKIYHDYINDGDYASYLKSKTSVTSKA